MEKEFNLQNCKENEEKQEYIDPVHGRVVKQYFAPYHDVTVYEDGYEDWFYIGE